MLITDTFPNFSIARCHTNVLRCHQKADKFEIQGGSRDMFQFGPVKKIDENQLCWLFYMQINFGRRRCGTQASEWKGKLQLNLAISNSVNSKSPLFRSQAESPSFDRRLVLTGLFRNPAISNYFSCPVGLRNSEVRAMQNTCRINFICGQELLGTKLTSILLRGLLP